MELKPYQQQVINDIAAFLEKLQETKDIRQAFTQFWVGHPRTPLNPFPGTAIEPYKEHIPGVPNICAKVPTAGGKTFIACNALKTVFDAFDYDKPKAVVWLVPSITILDQTINNLKNPAHPYRQKINAHFGNRVEVFDKATLLQGSGFNATSIKEQLSIMVFSFDSLRARNKEDRKVFQENGNLQSFEYLLGKENDITLGAVIKQLNPVVIVDESHNAESALSIDMLKELNPCFILDLTATPRNNSNIISFIDAMELKRENMVKLPVIVYNHQDKTEVINSSLQLQKRLELQAAEEEKKGGKYIRPIVLFQVQPKSGVAFLNEEEEKTNVQKLKDKLIELLIPEEQIKIKTAAVNEIKSLDLMSRDCPVRFIITINALKEGWDCSFAYILASLADKSSAVDVEQILGRVLRQPYVMKHQFPLLNVSYVLTASSRFLDTLDNIVKGLNKAGFSDKDYKLPDTVTIEPQPKADPLQQLDVFANSLVNAVPATASSTTGDDLTSDIDTTRVVTAASIEIPSQTVADIERTATEQVQQFERTVYELESTNSAPVPNEIQQLVKTQPVKQIFKEQAAGISLPQFFLKVPASQFSFGGDPDYCDQPLEREDLLSGFELSKESSNIQFDNIVSELYKIDLDETKKEHTPTFLRIDGSLKENILTYILDPSRKGARVANVTKRITDLLGSMDPIPQSEITKYVKHIVESFDDARFNDFGENVYSYVRRIKDRIGEHSENYAEKRFKNWLDTDKIFIKPSFNLPPVITPGNTAKDLPKSLYEKEGDMNGFEERVINEVGNMQNIAFWTRNQERKGFKINGFINHYPDFIIYTKSGKVVVLETKGDHLDAQQKIRLGHLWASKAGNQYRYFMVYEYRSVEGAYKLEDFLQTIREM